LETVSDQPLPPAAFQFETYLGKGATITDSTGSGLKSFYYQQGKGSLENQEDHGRTTKFTDAAQSPLKSNDGLMVLSSHAYVFSQACLTPYFLIRGVSEAHSYAGLNAAEASMQDYICAGT
jgi:hypothetical protein